MNVIKATKKDRKAITQILVESFPDNPSVNFTVKKRTEKIYKRLANYVFRVGYRKKGVYITADKKGVIVFYNFHNAPKSLLNVFEKIFLVFGVIGIFRIRTILPREKFIQKSKLNFPDYMYCWFIGVKNENRGKGNGVRLKNYIFKIADKEKIPVLMETTIPINKKIYERYGFKIYETWKVPNQHITYWLMCKDPS